MSDEVSGTILANPAESPVVAINCRNNQTDVELSGTLQAKSNGGTSVNYQNPVAVDDGAGYAVRRLTPVECERLQGFPDNWTRIPYRGRPAEECPDSPRYKSIGNSMATPVMRWIFERIEAVDLVDQTPVRRTGGAL